jgi:hypothetical protein
MSAFPRSEVEAAHERYVETRERIRRGELSYGALALHFTDDGTFIDPAWGRCVGRKAIEEVLVLSMAGLDDWSFPHEWRIVEGNRLVASWLLRLPGRRPDGGYFQARGLSIFEYAGSGLFSYEEDVLNVMHVMQLIQEANWQPTKPINMPPMNPPR